MESAMAKAFVEVSVGPDPGPPLDERKVTRERWLRRAPEKKHLYSGQGMRKGRKQRRGRIEPCRKWRGRDK